jgi:serine phosphatase RsbU (regulator of sigma subunit)
MSSQTMQIDSVLKATATYQESSKYLINISDENLLKYVQDSRNSSNGKSEVLNALCWRNFRSNPPLAMEYALALKEIAEKTNNKEALLASYDNLSYLNLNNHNNEEAIFFMLAALKQKELLKDTAGIAISLSGLATINYNMNKYETAMDYYRQVLEIEKLAKREFNIATCYNNIGLCYVGLDNIDKGLEMYFKADSLFKELGQEIEMRETYENIGDIYNHYKEDPIKSLYYYKKSVAMHEEVNAIANLSSAHSSMSQIYAKMKDFDKAKIHGNLALKFASQSENKKHLLKAHEGLSNVYRMRSNYELAYQYLERAFSLKDTLYNDANAKQIAEMQTKYETEKKETENNLLKAESKLNKTEIEKKSFQRNMLIIGLLVALLAVIYIAYSLNQKKKTNALLFTQNEEIVAKNSIIAEKNKDITDSINYAQRIQDAILPDKELVQNYFDSFIYYAPKDIVSGDFYWIKKNDNKLYFAVVDCTGHGVPGAFMSIIGYNSLNRIIDDFKLTNTGEILDGLNKLVIEALGKTEEKEFNIRDGMDMSFCSIDLNTNVLECSGANNSLYLVKNKRTKLDGHEALMNDEDSNFYEIKADKMAIGGGENIEKYKTHTIQLDKGDSIFLFSDGYPDQFGGPKGKKFMYKRFKKMLYSVHSKDANKQEEVVVSTLKEWMEGHSQLDDICVMGLNING